MFSTPSIWGALSDSGTHDIFWAAVNAGAPTSGTSGTGFGICGPGSLLIDYTNKLVYINTNTKASPTWTPLGGGGVASFVAAGSTQADGVAITTVNGTVLVTGANATKGAVLPVGVIGARLLIVNDAAANAVLKIYGNTGDSATINGVAGSTAYSMAAKTSTTFIFTAAGKWQTSPLVSS